MAEATVIGERIKDLREKCGFSSEKFCDIVGISRSALSMYETGQRVPRDEIKLKIARCLGVSIETLFFTQ